MNALMKVLIALILVAVVNSSVLANTASVPKIGIVLPLEHPAMQEIVDGFELGLKANYPHPVSIHVENAQNDLNLQRAIISQFRDQHDDLIVPIGTSTTQMTAMIAKQQSIVALAADDTSLEAERNAASHVAMVHDEINSLQALSFLHQAYPALTRITLIHSASDKIFPEVQQAILDGKKEGIEVKPIMVTTLPDLYAALKNLPKDTQAIFILKDGLMASGATNIAQEAMVRHILFMASDQDSVKAGAHFALGVYERQIGEEGGRLVAEILSGQSPGSLPIVHMTKLTVFVNQHSFQAIDQAISPIVSAAATSHYPTQVY